MNSVISAFKGKKNAAASSSAANSSAAVNAASSNEKHNGILHISSAAHHHLPRGHAGGHSSSAPKKKAISAQDNGYQYLRHIREIDTATKMLSPVAVSDELLAEELLHFRPPCIDVVDHAAAALELAQPQPRSRADWNMNGDTTPCLPPAVATDNGNCSSDGCEPAEQLLDAGADDDESENSLAACTSSSSEHSSSTVINGAASSAANGAAPSLVVSPAKSLCSNSSATSSSSSSSHNSSSASLSPSSSSCDVTTIIASPTLSSSSASLNAGGTVEGSTTSDPTSDSAAPRTLPIIMPNGNSSLATVPPHSQLAATPTNSAANTPKHARYSKPRLSLSRFINHSMPSVHGRPNLSTLPGSATTPAAAAAASGANGATNPPKRTSTHQRNLSLDFRSMGILLPPVSQVTNTRINLTQHHRNRSLDSALQRIPEVEVSSPNESENTFCTTSILGTTMCSKIVTSATEIVTAAPSTPTTAAAACSTSPSFASVAEVVSTTEPTLGAMTLLPQVVVASASDVHVASANPSVIVEPTSILRIRPKSSESANSSSSASSTSSSVAINSTFAASSSAIGVTASNISTNKNNSKKREDLTSLGSDDSGIICGSDSDQLSLKRIRDSHESLDSAEMDAEEECIEMLDTASMDEEYGMLQSDLCFYQSPDTDCRTLRPSRKNKQSKQQQQPLEATDVSRAGGCGDGDDATTEKERISSDAEDGSTTAQTTPTSDGLEPSTSTSGASKKPLTEANLSVMETTKNEVLFKSFFGATKNAIFRTAQSIIENHEKKNAAKNRSEDAASVALSAAATPATATESIKSPTDFTKKKEFFGLITTNASKKAAAAAAAAAAASASSPAATPTAETPTNATPTPTNSSEQKSPLSELQPALSATEKTLNLGVPSSSTVPKSASITSLHKLRVPGVVKCFIKEKPAPSGGEALQHKTESSKGPSGLLRFFESPVFNIHFAVHYLFYSKEPGVLSFIGNKIFSFPDQEVDLYIPQLIVMYIQMDELAEVLDPYLTIRCRKSVDFSLKCLWLLEAYNYHEDSLSNASGRKPQLALMKEIFSRKERKVLSKQEHSKTGLYAAARKTHHRSQSDATVLLTDASRGFHPSASALSITSRMYQQPPYTTATLTVTPAKLTLGDLTSGRAFDNGCSCFESVRGQVNGLLGQKTVCSCGAPKTAPQKEFMRALINVGKNLTSLPSKAEKTSALRMFLNLINKNLPARVWLPLYSHIAHHVVRITEEKTAVLNSKDKTPYIIYVEVLEVPDIYSSPVIAKMMPTLRHTKSVEHLEGGCGQLNHSGCSRTSSCSSHSGGANAATAGRRKDKVTSECSNPSDAAATLGASAQLSALHLNDDDVWSQEDDDITAQYVSLRQKDSERDAISQMSLDSCDSRDHGIPVLFNIGDVRTRHCNNLSCENTKSFSNDPEDPSAAALKEPWDEKEKQIRESSPYGHLANWRLLSAIVKCGDDLRQELMATQLLQMFKIIWQEEGADLWVRPYKIVCLSNDSGLIEPILNTVSLHQIKKNSSKSLRDYFVDEYGCADGERFCLAQKNFVQSCAAYCLISYLLQVKDRHNGNILLHSDGHIIHIDFGFILSISPKNLGFEQSPFKLTAEFVEVMGGTSSKHWREFNRLLLVGMMTARKHMDRIINFVEIMRSNAQLPCFKNGCSGTVQNLRKRFHMNLTEQEMERKVEQLVQDSVKSLSTKLYDGYQYYTNGIL